MQREHMVQLGDIRSIHFVGIGGIGMSGIAEILLDDGYRISGSDLQESPILGRLRKLGAQIAVGHRAGNLQGAQAVVYSSAVPEDNVEIAAARNLGLPIVHRAEMLAELMRRRTGLTVAGTHGKTTTTSMVSLLLQEAGLDPTMIIGARLPVLGSNARTGRGDFLVAEADESDRSFLLYRPVYTVVTNVDEDHMESYGGLTALQEAFLEHMRSVPFYGAVVACLDDANLRTLLPRVKRRIITYGFDSEADMTARNPRHSAFRSTYECVSKGQTLGEIELQVPGRHNIVNSLGAAAVGALLKLPFESTRHALRVFRGAERRMEWKGEKREVWVIDDYAHHPTEIRATLDACRLTGRRIVMVFQPHRFSRTRDLMSDLARCFEKAHRLFLLDIYSAGEKPIAGVTSQKLAQEIGRHREVTYVDDRAILLDLLLEETRPGDLLLTAGAGNVWQVGEEFLEQSH